MDRDLFAARLAGAAEAARAFAGTMIVENLPEQLVFRLRGTALSKCDAETAVAELWREGHVPEWVNVSVADETGAATVIELLRCDRFTDDDTLLYHRREGSPPFHVLGPVLPPDDGTPFSIHLRAECWDTADLQHLTSAADDIWSFDLHTAAFDDRALLALPTMPHLKIFEHHACTLGGHGLSPFARFPGLRILRLHLKDTFRIGDEADRLDTLADLTITGLPSALWGQSSLAEIAPFTESMSLSAAGILWLEGPFSPSVQSLNLSAADISGHPRLPSSLEHLTIRLGHGTDQKVAALLEGVTQVGSLTLRGTPVTDSVLPALERYSLRHLDLVDTSVTAEALTGFHARHPEVSLFPRPDSYQDHDLTTQTTGYDDFRLP
jgi:hypothetical protein